MVRVQNDTLHDQLDQFMEEFQIVNWYIEVLEGGRNTKTLLKDFVQAQAEIKQLREGAKKTKSKLVQQLERKK